MKTAGLHHVALGARDVERVASFYREVLGLTELARHRTDTGALRSVWLALGAGAVLMIEATEAPARPRREGVDAGPFLLAFHVAREERPAWEARLKAAGAPIEGRTAATSYACDPEGNRVAVSCYALPPEAGLREADPPEANP